MCNERSSKRILEICLMAIREIERLAGQRKLAFVPLEMFVRHRGRHRWWCFWLCSLLLGASMVLSPISRQINLNTCRKRFRTHCIPLGWWNRKCRNNFPASPTYRNCVRPLCGVTSQSFGDANIPSSHTRLHQSRCESQDSPIVIGTVTNIDLKKEDRRQRLPDRPNGSNSCRRAP